MTEYEKIYPIDGTNIRIVCGDITKADTDAIVNAANENLLGGGGVDGAIWTAAGIREMFEQCKDLGGCEPGDAKITDGCNLPARYVIHAVGPRYYQLDEKESERLLRSCYKRAFELARENGCKTIAFPAISCGVFGYPLDDAIIVAYDACISSGSDFDIIDLIFLFDEDYDKAVETIKSHISGLNRHK